MHLGRRSSISPRGAYITSPGYQFFPYVIAFPLYLSCSFSERCFFGFWICIHWLPALAFSFLFPIHGTDCEEGPGCIYTRALSTCLTATSGRAFPVLLLFLVSLFLMSLMVEDILRLDYDRGWLATLPTLELSLAWANRLLDKRRQRQKALHEHRACCVMFLRFHNLVCGSERKELVRRIFCLRWKVAILHRLLADMQSWLDRGFFASGPTMSCGVDTGSLPMNGAG